MANPIAFEPKKIDPRLELEKRLAKAPVEHAEALLVAYDLLGEAHEKGVLDLLLGAVGSKNEIFAKIAEYAKEPIATQAMRNGIVLLRLIGSLDPEVLLKTVEAIAPPIEAEELPKTEKQVELQAKRREGRTLEGKKVKKPKPPSLFALARRMNSEDSRKGLDVAITLLAGLGKSMQ